LAALFAQVGRKAGDDPREIVIFDRHDGEVKHPVTHADMRPKFLSGEEPDLKGESRREALARWLTSSQNPYFARNVANIIWGHFLGRGIKVLLDCISQVPGTQDKFPGLPRGARAVDISDGNSSTYFLTTFGRATRTTVSSCEVKINPNLSQALHLLNGDTLQTKIEQGGVVKKLLQQGEKPDQVIENLYFRCLGRKPTEKEAAQLKAFFTPDAKPAQVLNDIFWSLLNAKEFVFNH
jgi:hypothetical protein